MCFAIAKAFSLKLKVYLNPLFYGKRFEKLPCFGSNQQNMLSIFIYFLN